MSIRQGPEDGLSEALSGVVQDVHQTFSMNTNGARLLHEVLTAPWLRPLLQIYDCLQRFQRGKSSPALPHASALSQQVMTLLMKVHSPSAEARELYCLLRSPHIQALLMSHDRVARSDYGPVWVPPPTDGEPGCVEDLQTKPEEPHMAPGRWSSLRRLAPSEAELPGAGGEAGLLHRPSFLPSHQSTADCPLCPHGPGGGGKRLNRSAPSIFSPGPGLGTSSGGLELCEDSGDYAYPPPPVPAFSLSLPGSPRLQRPQSTAHTAPCSPAPQRASGVRGDGTIRRERREPGLGRTGGGATQRQQGGGEQRRQDVLHLERTMAAVTEMIGDNMEDNTQALHLLADVVEKLRGLVVTRTPSEALPWGQVPPAPPQAVRKPPTPYPRRLSSSSSSSSSSISSVGLAAPGSKTVSGEAPPPRPGGGGGQVRLNNGSLPGVPSDGRRTGCLTLKRRK